MSARLQLSLVHGGLVKTLFRTKHLTVGTRGTGIRIPAVVKSAYMDRTAGQWLILIGIMTTGKASHTLTTGAPAAGRFPKAASRRGRVAARTRRNALGERRQLMVSTVSLIMSMDSAALFEGLARCMPVWVADTTGNAPLKNVLTAERKLLSITWFPLRHGELLEAAAVRIGFSLDDHYNEDAQAEGYKTLLVFGASYVSSMNAELAALGFKHVEPAAFGFVAAKGG